MTREEYLNELKSSILSLSTDEQAEAIQYYSDYFEEADDDEKVMQELGTPDELAKTIIKKFANALVNTKSQESDDSSSDDCAEHEDFEGSRTDALYFEFEKNLVKNLSMDFGAAEVAVIEGEKFSVETRGLPAESLNCYVNNEGTLVLNNSHRLNLNFWSHNRTSRFIPRILVCVPKNASVKKLRIAMGAGKLVAKNISLNCEAGSIDVDAGSAALDGIFGGRINMRCGMGSLEYKGTLTGSSNIDCGMGSIKLKLKGEPSFYSYDAKVGLGDFRFNGEKKSGFCQVYSNQKLSNHISVNCGMGSVNIQMK